MDETQPGTSTEISIGSCNCQNSDGARGGNGRIAITQEVLLQSFRDKFDLPKQSPMTPAIAGNILTKEDANQAVHPKVQTYCQSGTGNMMHMMQWSLPDICDATRDMARHMQSANNSHVQAMHKAMSYCTKNTPERDNPKFIWRMGWKERL